MNKYPDSPQASAPEQRETGGIAELEFPVAPDFLSLPPRIEPQAMLRRIEETMPWRSTRPGERERRFASRIQVEFTL